MDRKVQKRMTISEDMITEDNAILLCEDED